ncbi:MAG: hypothetical protein HON21_08360 [Gammaproteobacteria bacterium]|nr:hypothetical protein [Gammaproteobacteria bacterium]
MMAKALGSLGTLCESDGSWVIGSSGDSKNQRNPLSMVVDETSVPMEPFRHVFNVDNMKLMIGEYDVKIFTKSVSQFTTPSVTVFVATECRIRSPKERRKVVG